MAVRGGIKLEGYGGTWDILQGLCFLYSRLVIGLKPWSYLSLRRF